MLVDIMLFYVENCVDFTAEFGDINEAFYISAEGMYEQVINEVNAGGQALYQQFAGRLKSVVDHACDGWGFKDSLSDSYFELNWVPDSDD